MKFEFDHLKGTLRPFKVIKSTTMPHGPDGKPATVTEVQLELELEAVEALSAIGWLFNDIDLKKLGQSIAGDDDRGGIKLTAHTKLPAMNFALYYPEEDDPIFDRSECVVTSKPQLKYTETGDATLLLRPKVKLTDKELPRVCKMIDADIRVSTEKTQSDMSEDTRLAA
jgi:hypothetical protein